MGKDLALEFRCMCDNGWLQPGCVHEMESGYIINFPTLVRLASEQGISLRELLKRGFHGRSIIVPVAEVKQE